MSVKEGAGQPQTVRGAQQYFLPGRIRKHTACWIECIANGGQFIEKTVRVTHLSLFNKAGKLRVRNVSVV